MAAQDLREIKDNFLLEAGLVDARTSLQEMKISEYWDDKKIELKKDYEVDGELLGFTQITRLYIHNILMKLKNLWLFIM